MKQPRPKIHLLDCDEPLLGFHGLLVRCGLTLQNATPQFMVTEEANAGAKDVLFRGGCRKCVELEPAADAKRTYIYGLCEGQSAKDAESEEAA